MPSGAAKLLQALPIRSLSVFLKKSADARVAFVTPSPSAEPARAFANLRTALKPSGRLALACWRKFDENPWLQVPLRAALEHLPPLPRPGPENPGPFSFAGE